MGCIYTYSHNWLVIYTIIVGLSALLVSTDRAMREPQYVERASDGSTFFFVSCHNLQTLSNDLAPKEPGCSKES